jgi:hypothetical protein
MGPSTKTASGEVWGLTRGSVPSEGGTGAGRKSGFEIMVLTNLRSERGMSLIVGGRPPSEGHRSTDTFPPFGALAELVCSAPLFTGRHLGK